MRARDIPARDRLLAKLHPQPNGCSYWAGFIDPQGYGRIGYKGRRSTPLQQAVYDCFIGPIPVGMMPDHRCHTDDPLCAGGPTCLHRRCGNPEHLELVNGAENTRRGRSFSALNTAKTHCPKGHAYDEGNTYTAGRRRYCVTCYTALHGSPPVRLPRRSAVVTEVSA